MKTPVTPQGRIVRIEGSGKPSYTERDNIFDVSTINSSVSFLMLITLWIFQILSSRLSSIHIKTEPPPGGSPHLNPTTPPRTPVAPGHYTAYNFHPNRPIFKLIRYFAVVRLYREPPLLPPLLVQRARDGLAVLCPVGQLILQWRIRKSPGSMTTCNTDIRQF